MSSGAAERNLEAATGLDALRQAGVRVRTAHEAYEKFRAIAPPPHSDAKPHLLEDMKAAQAEIDAAEEHFARLLREDPDFIKRSAEAERRLAEGPPWDDVINSADLLPESGSKDH